MPTELPIDSLLPQICANLAKRNSFVLEAPTGAGKTTRVPPALLEAGLAGTSRIVMLEPRRLAARAAARRIADERGTRLGGEIGYHVRFDRQATRETRLLIVTPGILLRELLDHPYLDGTRLVLLDEFHERGLDGDLVLGLLRLMQQTVRPELKLVVMSATLAGDQVAAYLDDCPVIRSEGRLHPVAVLYQPRSETARLASAVEAAARQLLAETTGDLLVFLPGTGEIRQCQRQLEALAAANDLELLPLYGDLPAEQQDRVLRLSARRKIVLATNVAETSVTIPGVTGVIDSGLARELHFDTGVGLDRLEVRPISKASAAQRAGRAGRTQPGVCIRLWREADQGSRPEHTEPEIRRVDLSGALLQLLALGEAKPEQFPWLDAPRPESLKQARRLLELLEAARGDQLTPLGKQLAKLPAPPRLGRLLLEGHRLGFANRAALAAALLAERSPFQRIGGGRARATPTSSDLLEQVEALEAFDAHGQSSHNCGALDRSAAESTLRVRGQLLRLLPEGKKAADATEEGFLRMLLAAYPDRVARRREKGSRRALMLGGRGVRLADSSGVNDAELFLAIDVEAAEPEAIVRLASAVRRDWLPEQVQRTEIVSAFDERTERIVAWKRHYYQDLVLEEKPASVPSSIEARQTLIKAAMTCIQRVLPEAGSLADQLLCRIRWLREQVPELDLRVFSVEELAGFLPEIAAGTQSFAELRNGPWHSAILQSLHPRQRQALERDAPTHFILPSGRRASIVYEPGRAPVIAARIQDFFGLQETPRFARGRAKALLRLLAPNGRPQQVTDDLASFWKNTYATIRKELRGRYPKHKWPENPLTAGPPD